MEVHLMSVNMRLKEPTGDIRIIQVICRGS
jgi:hypothetical protein